MTYTKEDVCSILRSMLPSHYIEEDGTFTSDVDGIQYQVHDYSNREFSSILIRYPDDRSHCYIEYYLEEGKDVYDVIYAALSEETSEALERQWYRKNCPNQLEQLIKAQNEYHTQKLVNEAQQMEEWKKKEGII